jgi:uncharacterized membrane protein YeaQ/YmgE (transglycosylase-associated protein family)
LSLNRSTAPKAGAFLTVAALELSESAQQWVNLILLWIGFGTLAGLVAKALLPGREPAGTVGTMTIGIVGSVLGPLSLSLALEQKRFNPISPLGFLAAAGAALVVLIAYRVLVAFLAVRRRGEQ